MKLLKAYKNTHRGFTLIELLVVVAIIGLLSTIVLSSVNAARLKANIARRLSDMREIQTALENYYDDYGVYPTTGGASQSQCASWGSFAANAVIPGLVSTYMPTFPADPTMNATNSTSCYLYKSNGTDYALLDLAISDVGWTNSMYAQYPTFIDPAREGGAVTQCGTSFSSWAWKISTPAYICK
ncbi:MAG: type II secretion system protein [Candidatus Pacebacteria bacterium]|nr:type II secretion system protein [Candidatus Paceibacterota bacterium]